MLAQPTVHETGSRPRADFCSENCRNEMERMINVHNSLIGLAVGLVLTTTVPTYAQNLTGRDVWVKFCASCHGASGAGSSGGQEPPSPSLLATRLDRAALVETISCGRPGTQMPSWLDGAYTAVSCFGLPLGLPLESGATNLPLLDQAEIDMLVDYLMAEIVNR